jgi:hypothetical protein
VGTLRKAGMSLLTRIPGRRRTLRKGLLVQESMVCSQNKRKCKGVVKSEGVVRNAGLFIHLRQKREPGSTLTVKD